MWGGRCGIRHGPWLDRRYTSFPQVARYARVLKLPRSFLARMLQADALNEGKKHVNIDRWGHRHIQLSNSAERHCWPVNDDVQYKFKPINWCWLEWKLGVWWRCIRIHNHTTWGGLQTSRFKIVLQGEY